MSAQSEVTKLINIFLDGLVSVSNDAGWKGDSLLGKVIEFAGPPPRGSGNDQSNLSMINAIEKFRAKHVDYAMIERIVWRLLTENQTTRRHIMALLVKHYYHGINERASYESEGKTIERAYDEDDKIGLWMEHLNRYPWADKEILNMDREEARQKYRYGCQRCGPRLIKREVGL